jgi:hypothetical protein
MDIAVTVPKSFGLDQWIAEGDAAGAPWSGEEWHFYLGGHLPRIFPSERVYVFYNGRLRGFAPLVRIEQYGHRFALVRHGDAQAVTIAPLTPGFRGWRYRWWQLSDESPFPEWQKP